MPVCCGAALNSSSGSWPQSPLSPQTPGAPQLACLEAARHEPQLPQGDNPSQTCSLPLLQPPTLPGDHRDARAALVRDSPHAHAGEHPIPHDGAEQHKLCATSSLPWRPLARVQHLTSGPHQCRAVTTRWSLQQFFTTRFYFSFVLTKNIEVVHCRQSVRFPVWVRTSMLCYNIHPSAWGMKAENFTPTLPWPQEPPVPHVGGSVL